MEIYLWADLLESRYYRVAAVSYCLGVGPRSLWSVSSRSEWSSSLEEVDE